MNKYTSRKLIISKNVGITDLYRIQTLFEDEYKLLFDSG